VDFGFGSLIEKFEERFGKAVTTVLLAIVGMGIAAGCIGLIGNNIIKPGLDLYSTTNWPDFKKWLVENLIPTIVSLGILYVLTLLLAYVGNELYRRTWARRKKRKEVEAWIKRATAEYEVKLRGEMAHMGEQLEAQITAHTREMKDRVFGELRTAMEMRDRARAISEELIGIIRPWLHEIDASKPEEVAGRTKEMILALESTILKQHDAAAAADPPEKIDSTKGGAD